ncbi:hypothetical protein K2173_001336 [Erythroxylum novogranatense]|uniref:Probable purine permease n=1 Tax=Erythroxylum novogranatense TaxID=1862640 RepID=A0AAV8T4U7_9ROSI|nr:hypothetical protein K2173_001336 [Erythroxylum novogranatense]
MVEARQVQLSRLGSLIKHTNMTNQPTSSPKNMVKWWLLVALFAFFILAGQSTATLLGRLYFDKGGKSKWMGAFVQTCGFPILIPLYFFSLDKKSSTTINVNTNSPSIPVLALVYVTFGVFVTFYCILYALGLSYLPVSTYSLLCASQLGFNALFSYFINSQKFTPYIINSLFLLTLSAVLLVFGGSDAATAAKISKGKYVIGFICTVGACSLYGLALSLTQYSFRRILKVESFKSVLNMIFFPSLVSSSAMAVGLFASGEWKSLGNEMESFSLGKASYMLTLIGTAVSWQVFSIGSVGLIFKVSALFSNVIATVGLPVVPVLAVFVFHEKMDGNKVVAMILALWGFVSYAYQHYHGSSEPKDDEKSSANNEGVSKSLEVSV